MIKKDNLRVTITFTPQEVRILNDICLTIRKKTKSQAVKFLIRAYDVKNNT